MISVGGWNSPHPSDESNAHEAFLAFDKWNKDMVSCSDIPWDGFQGIYSNDFPFIHSAISIFYRV